MQKRLKGSGVWIVVICVFLILYMIIDSYRTETNKMAYGNLIRDIQQGAVTSLVLSENSVIAKSAEYPDGVTVHIPSISAF
ncbi:MAG: hypothetical protein J1F64_06630, partial [Oscillospiraceae bacterium]|nr:hypothetical protein [Oscillospiraceae bacterium]